jgi:hypothetical protein
MRDESEPGSVAALGIFALVGSPIVAVVSLGIGAGVSSVASVSLSPLAQLVIGATLGTAAWVALLVALGRMLGLRRRALVGTAVGAAAWTLLFSFSLGVIFLVATVGVGS